MSDKATAALRDVPLKMLRSEGEPVLKTFQSQREAHGKVLERAIQIAGYSKKEATAELGVEHQSQLTAWLKGDEHQQTWRFQQHPRLGPALLIAQAEVTNGAKAEIAISVPLPDLKVGT